MQRFRGHNGNETTMIGIAGCKTKATRQCYRLYRSLVCWSVLLCCLQMLREMQDEQRAMNNSPAEMQAQAHASAVKRFTGGGFAVN